MGRVFGLLGLVALLAAGVLGGIRAAEVSDHVSAEGVVVGLDWGRRSATPVVEFATPDGRTVRFTGIVGSRPPAFEIGERVPVSYPPEDPSDALIATYWATWFFPTLFGLLAGAWLLVAAILLTVHRTRSRSASE